MALSVNPDQVALVASNSLSVAQSKVYEYLVPVAVCLRDVPIGFALYGQDPETGRVYIVRLMIDRNFQGSGYGTNATRLLIERLKQQYRTNTIYVSIVPANLPADHMYRSLGFLPTGEQDEDGEIILKLKCSSEAEQGAAPNP